MIDQRHAERQRNCTVIISSPIIFRSFLANLSAIRAPAPARFLSGRKQRAMVGALHNCIISDTVAKSKSFAVDTEIQHIQWATKMIETLLREANVAHA